MIVLVDLPAVRAGRLAARLSTEATTEPVRELRAYLRGADVEEIPSGIRLGLRLPPLEIAGLADEIRTLANEWPFLSFRLVADPPACTLEVTGTDAAIGMARAVFGEIGS